MNKLQANSNVLSNGDVAVEMIYNNKSHAKKLIMFFMVVIVMAAIAFSACFFALEISRTNAYNNRLNNSIVEPSQETPPEIINPTTPENNNSTTDNNEPGGSASDESETGIAEPYNETYSVIIQAVWGLTDDINQPNSTSTYDLTSGIYYAAEKSRSLFYLTVNNSNLLSCWSGTIVNNECSNSTATFPNELDPLGNAANNVAFNTAQANAIGVNRDRVETLTVTMNFDGLANLRADYIMSFMRMDENGTMYDICEHKAFDSSEVNAKHRITVPLSWHHDPYMAKGTTYIYAVITKRVSVRVENASNFKTSLNFKLGSGSGSPGIKNATDAYFTSITMYNCIYGAIHMNSDTIMDAAEDALYNIAFGDRSKFGYDIKFNFQYTINYGSGPRQESIELSICNGKRSGLNDDSRFYFTTLQDLRLSHGYSEISTIRSIWNNGMYDGNYSSSFTDGSGNFYGTTFYGFELGSNVQTWSLNGEDDIYLNTKFRYGIRDNIAYITITSKDAFATVENSSTKWYCEDFEEVESCAQIGVDSSSNIIVTFNKSFSLNRSPLIAIKPSITTTFKSKDSSVEINMQNGINFDIGGDPGSGQFLVNWYVSINRLEITNCLINVYSKVDNLVSSLPTVIVYRVGNTIKPQPNSHITNLYVDSEAELTTIDFSSSGTTGRIDKIYSYGGKVVINGDLSSVYTATDRLEFNIDYELTQDVSSSGDETLYKENIEINDCSNLNYINFKLIKIQKYTGESANFALLFAEGLNISSGCEFSGWYNFGSLSFNQKGGDIYNTGQEPFVYITLTKTILITSYADLLTVAQYDSYPAGVTYVLNCDIDLDMLFKGIGAYNEIAFTGTFDGNGYSLRFMYSSNSNGTSAGLFYGLQDATVKNLVLTGDLIRSGRYIMQGSNYLGICYGLAFETSGTVNIINVLSDLDTASMRSDTQTTNPIVELVYQNYGTLNFINCAASGTIVRYYDTTAKCEERSHFLGFNHSNAYVNFYNCVVDSTTDLHNSKNKNGLFVGWSNNNPATFANITFENCYKVGDGENPVVGGVGYSDPPINNFSDTDFEGMTVNTSAEIKDIENNLNTWIDNNKTTYPDLFEWYEGCFCVFKINSGSDLKKLAEWIEDKDSTTTGALRQRTNFVGRAVKITSELDTIYVEDWSGFDKFYGVFEGNNKTIHITGTQGLVAEYVSDTTKIQNLNIAGTITGRQVGAILGHDRSNDGRAYITNCANYATITGSFSVGGIFGGTYVGAVRIERCYNFGTIIAENNDVYIGGIAGQASNVSNCVSAGKIIVPDYSNLPQYFGLIVGSGYKVNNCVFMCEAEDKNGTPLVVANGTTQGAKIIGSGTATRCFVKGGETHILNSPLNTDGTATETTYVGCSTFKDLFTSLMYNGSRFGYLKDALSDNTSTTNWVIEQKILIDGSTLNVPVYKESTQEITENLTITEVDNLNAINDMIITNNISFSFSGYTLTFKDGLVLENFAGLGNADIAVQGGTWIGNTIYLNNSTVFYNILNTYYINDFEIKGVTGATNNYSLANKAERCTFTNCINNVNLTAISGQTYLGGLVAEAITCKFNNCKNNGNLQSDVSNNSVGGIAGYIKYCTFDSCINYGSVQGTTIGGIAGKCDGNATIKNSENRGSFATSGSYTGGILGYVMRAAYSTITIESCNNYANITNTGAYTGGIVGYSDIACYLIIKNCNNYGSISLNNDTDCREIGGIVGYSYIDTYFVRENALTVENCNNYGAIALTARSYVRLGGVVGYAEIDTDKQNADSVENYILIKNCNNNGSFIFSECFGVVVGGVFGYCEISYKCVTIENCNNNGSLTLSECDSIDLGGILGCVTSRLIYPEGSLIINNCNNHENITLSDCTDAQLGGIVGYVYYDNSITITNCINYGTISGGSTIGGIVGDIYSANITNCTNYGTISGGSTIGGIVGGGSSTTIDNCYTNCILKDAMYIGGVIGNARGTTSIKNTITDGYFIGCSGGSVAGVLIYVGSSAANVVNCVSFATMKDGNIAGLVLCADYESSVIIDNSYFFGDFASENYQVMAIGDNLTLNNCGYNFNNIEQPSNKLVYGTYLDWYVFYIGEDTYNVFKLLNGSYELVTFGEFMDNLYNLYIYYNNEWIKIEPAGNDDDSISDFIYEFDTADNVNYDEATDFDWLDELLEKTYDFTIELIYAKDTNPVWSSSAYIKYLFKTETESMLNGTNTKLELNWYDTDTATAGIQSGYDTTFWSNVFAE